MAFKFIDDWFREKRRKGNEIHNLRREVRELRKKKQWAFHIIGTTGFSDVLCTYGHAFLTKEEVELLANNGRMVR